MAMAGARGGEPPKRGDIHPGEASKCAIKFQTCAPSRKRRDFCSELPTFVRKSAFDKKEKKYRSINLNFLTTLTVPSPWLYLSIYISLSFLEGRFQPAASVIYLARVLVFCCCFNRRCLRVFRAFVHVCHYQKRKRKLAILSNNFLPSSSTYSVFSLIS